MSNNKDLPSGKKKDDNSNLKKERNIGIYLLLFLLALIITPVIVYKLAIDEPFIRTLVYVSSSGGIGGLIYLIRGYNLHKRLGDFDLKYSSWYFFRPFMSIVAGVFVYLFIKGGLLVGGMSSEIDYSRNLMFYCAIAFLAGFSLKEFVDKLYDLSRTIFATKKIDEEVNPKK